VRKRARPRDGAAPGRRRDGPSASARAAGSRRGPACAVRRAHGPDRSGEPGGCGPPRDCLHALRSPQRVVALVPAGSVCGCLCVCVRARAARPLFCVCALAPSCAGRREREVENGFGARAPVAIARLERSGYQKDKGILVRRRHVSARRVMPRGVSPLSAAQRVQSTPRGLTNAAPSFQADDSHHGDRFGRTVVLHGNHLIVGERVKLITGHLSC
jgi:hypothetical protein